MAAACPTDPPPAASPAPEARRWAATVAATLVSTYALDAVATAAGLALVVSGVLAGAGEAALAVVLAGSYAAWGAGLTVNLGANWALLEATGTSTSVFSKLGHALAGRRSGSVQARRVAAAAGYVGTELAKEAPYYLGAAGTAMLAEGVSAGEAVVFLAGANLGAAAYEYGLARLVRGLVGRLRPEKHLRAAGFASFERDWRPSAYLASYYGRVEADERETIAFFVEALRAVPAGGRVLIFGSGPTLHHVFAAARTAAAINVGDYLPANLREVRRWLAAEPGAHDWRPFVAWTLACEGAAADGGAVAGRASRTRATMGRLLRVDLRAADPLLGAAGGYDLVLSAYCADSVTDDRALWATYTRRIAGLVRPGGWLLVAALRDCRGYRVGGAVFPSAGIGAEDLRAVLAGELDELRVESRDLADRHGYAGILLAAGRRSR